MFVGLVCFRVTAKYYFYTTIFFKFEHSSVSYAYFVCATTFEGSKLCYKMDLIMRLTLWQWPPCVCFHRIGTDQSVRLVCGMGGGEAVIENGSVRIFGAEHSLR